MNVRAFEVTAWHRLVAAFRFGTLRVTAELYGVILSLLFIEVKYECLYVEYQLERHMYFHDIRLYSDAPAKSVVVMAILLS